MKPMRLAGANCRVNATVGRFAQMLRLFCGRGGGVLEIPRHHWPSWPPVVLHRRASRDGVGALSHPVRSAGRGRSAVTIMASEGPNSCNNHYSRTGAGILDTIGDCMMHLGQTAWYYRASGFVVAIAPDHMELVKQDFSREAARQYIYDNARRQTDGLVKAGRIAIPPLEFAEVEFGAMRTR